MATEKPDRFDQVDWSELSRSEWFDLSVNSIGMLVTSLPLAVLGLYDWQFIDPRTDTFEMIGVSRNLESLDYFFVLRCCCFSGF